MTFTSEQRSILSNYEGNFRTALDSGWSRGIGTTGYTTIHKIYQEATGHTFPFSPSCGSCMLHLLQRVGKLYFDDVDELLTEEAKVELSEQEPQTGKTSVKTTKKNGTKKA